MNKILTYFFLFFGANPALASKECDAKVINSHYGNYKWSNGKFTDLPTYDPNKIISDAPIGSVYQVHAIELGWSSDYKIYKTPDGILRKMRDFFLNSIYDINFFKNQSISNFKLDFKEKVPLQVIATSIIAPYFFQNTFSTVGFIIGSWDHNNIIAFSDSDAWSPSGVRIYDEDPVIYSNELRTTIEEYKRKFPKKEISPVDLIASGSKRKIYNEIAFASSTGKTLDLKIQAIFVMADENGVLVVDENSLLKLAKELKLPIIRIKSQEFNKLSESNLTIIKEPPSRLDGSVNHFLRYVDSEGIEYIYDETIPGNISINSPHRFLSIDEKEYALNNFKLRLCKDNLLNSYVEKGYFEGKFKCN
ncbi:MAG: hypothetical protein QE271_02100 [Bacteriovoracaceae bacterium]|nr:hypothetical protein [Bacteriovoracaceae bacterium]